MWDSRTACNSHCTGNGAEVLIGGTMMYVRRLFAKLTNFIRHGHAEAEMNGEAAHLVLLSGLKQLRVVAHRSEQCLCYVITPV